MFGAKKKQTEETRNSVMQKSSRGNMDEYEALRTIVAENAGLLNRVLEKIKIQRVLSGKAPNPAKGAEVSSESADKPREPEDNRPKKGKPK